MKLYNQLSKKVETFHPLNPDNVKIYTCGPTVYNFAHIGNFTSYIYWDLLVRTLIANRYKVSRILNLTDVGHLASDADDGEDKLEKGAKREGKTVWEIADFYAKAFLTDFRRLNLVEPTKICKATDYITQDIELVDILTEKGYTYKTTDGIYFDTSKFPRYADFAKLNLEQLKAGARVALSSEKRNISDFAVWKFIQPGEDHAMQWNYLDCPGYPGWHIECSAIVHHELGEPIDIHTGGIDHLPIHHTNEIAQSESAFETQMSRFWTHCNHITIDGQKASKSLGNTFTLDDLALRGFAPLDFKLWVLQGHYQSERNFSFDDLAAAKARRLNWRNRIAKSYQVASVADNLTFRQDFLNAVSDNLNSAVACSLIDNSQLSINDWQFIDEIFGLQLLVESPDINDEIATLINERQLARTQKDWPTADQLRDKLATHNITVLDTPEGPIWQYLE